MLYKRIIAKFGTSLITGGIGRLDLKAMASLVDQIAQLHSQGHEVIIVSSGAVAAGRQKLKADQGAQRYPIQAGACLSRAKSAHAYL